MDRIKEMQVFLRVAARKSFTLAAEDLLMPRATVTNTIKRLELRLNLRLLERTTRQVNLTPDGTAYYYRCEQLLSDLEALDNEFNSSATKGILRVNLQGTLAKHFVLPYLADFLAEYAEIQLLIGEDDRLVDLVKEGIDCVLRAGNLKDSSLVGKRIASLKQVTVVSPSYIEKYGLPSDIDNLDKHMTVGYALDSAARPTTLDFTIEQEVVGKKLPVLVTVSGADLYTAAAKAGLGLIQVPEYRIKQELLKGELVVVLSNAPPPPMPVSVLYPQRQNLSARTKVFVDWLETLFSQAK
ncbi:LysR substrate-binding domain-containing protein [Paraglaciecola sp. L3A3]|uniref:LysR substrate-binding domain-containing protein n=1 Tax=Paraglaciecola sp. L3A3 TaxID=2686358 RepID=UPI00131DD261|nr:LysR substrate-binding domain-containing protein [Paraglaciecola sp. L3A3]